MCKQLTNEQRLRKNASARSAYKRDPERGKRWQLTRSINFLTARGWTLIPPPTSIGNGDDNNG